MKKLTREELTARYNKEVAEKKQLVNDLISNYDMLDDDGYPTDECIEVVKNWHWSDAEEFFKFLKEHWYMASWGWSEGWVDHDWDEGRKVYQYHISTAGWSGNETLIRAMEENFLWHIVWIQSRRGGHYIFELDDRGDDEGANDAQ